MLPGTPTPPHHCATRRQTKLPSEPRQVRPRWSSKNAQRRLGHDREGPGECCRGLLEQQIYGKHGDRRRTGSLPEVARAYYPDLIGPSMRNDVKKKK